MTTGVELKKALGLSKIRYVKISRAIISARKILFVWYDSYRLNVPVTNHRIKRFPWVSTIVHGTDLAHGSNKKTVFTPPVSIEDFNGAIKGTLIVPVNLAGDHFIDDKQFSKKFEGFIGKGLNSLKEFVTLSDLKGNQGISDFGMNFKRQRSRAMGSETGVSKYIGGEIKIIDGKHIDFYFLSESTDIYPDDFIHREAPIENAYDLIRCPSKTYTIVIRILNVLGDDGWLSTYPDKTEISVKDMKDILEVSYIQIHSSVPAFYWQGGAYWLQQLDGIIYNRPIIKPKFWNRRDLHGDGNFFIDKITQSILNQIEFYKNQMAVSLTSKLRKDGYL